MTEAKRLNARASVLVERRRPVIDAWRRSRKKFVEKTAKPTWTSVWQNAGKELKFQNQTLSIETSFSFSSNFRYVLIFLSVFIWNSGQSIECKGQCPCPVCDCSKPRTVCQTNGNSFPGVKCYDPCRYFTSMITYHGNTRKTIPISSCNKPTNGVTELDYVNCYKQD